jgi:hypothetical protein
MPVLEYTTQLPASPTEVFDWHMRPGAFERLSPPWEPIQVVSRQGTVLEAGRVTLRICKGVCVTWTLQHKEIEPGRQFVDEQISGPFRRWRHTHRFLPDAQSGGCTIHDHIEYELPLGGLADSLVGRHIQQTLSRTFHYRQQQLQHDLARHRLATNLPPQRIVVSGATGLIGSALCSFLTSGGHRVDRLVRRAPQPGTTDIAWHPAQGSLDAAALEGADAVIHLAGENVASRWTAAKKKTILESRTTGTRLLAETLARLSRKPRVLISASAVGYYGNRGAAVLTEDSPPGDDFLADVCQAWEAAADPARNAGIRVVHPRIGVVLSSRGGALRAAWTPFSLGLGGPAGTGYQYVSWIDLDDLLGVLHFAMFNDVLAGPLNAVSANPVTNRRFSRTLADVLRRPILLRMPASLARLLLGEFADRGLLASQRVLPHRLTLAGFQFYYPDFESSLRHQLGS